MSIMFPWLFEGDRTLIALRMTGLVMLAATIVMMVIALVQIA